MLASIGYRQRLRIECNVGTSLGSGLLLLPGSVLSGGLLALQGYPFLHSTEFSHIPTSGEWSTGKANSHILTSGGTARATVIFESPQSFLRAEALHACASPHKGSACGRKPKLNNLSRFGVHRGGCDLWIVPNFLDFSRLQATTPSG